MNKVSVDGHDWWGGVKTEEASKQVHEVWISAFSTVLWKGELLG